MDSLDADLNDMTREQLREEVVKLRQGVRAHRDTSRHDLCWHHPDMWALLPEKSEEKAFPLAQAGEAQERNAAGHTVGKLIVTIP